MVQVRCPECGYLQTLSEERFVAISEDYLDCPHCHARVPKEWKPEPGEAIPEETRHKMLAFTRRILNGRNVAREVVYALESLVRHYGMTEDSEKALGIGYAILHDYRKAEGFLRAALEQSPDDLQLMRRLLETLLHEGKFEEAVAVGRSVIQATGARAQSEDVGSVALALKGIGREDEAIRLLDSFPDLDPRNPVVKQARKELNGTVTRGLRSLFGQQGPFQRFLGGASKVSVRWPGRVAKTAPDTALDDQKSSHEASSSATSPAARAKPDGGFCKLARLPALIEYWVYSRETDIPKWEDLRRVLAEQIPEREYRQRIFELLESLMSKDDLAIEYILKQDAAELFDYPEDMIPCNSKDFSEDDRLTLTEARMIVRVRLSLAKSSGVDYLGFMVRFVDSVRALTSGVVQDAVSHALWGTSRWTTNVIQAGGSAVQYHLLLEILDEGGFVWIHTHGMQKFGMPDLELEGIPTELMPPGRKLIAGLAETLISMQDQEIDTCKPVEIPGTPLLVGLEFRPPDQEGHFPGGSLRLLPFIQDHDPYDPTTLERSLTLFGAQARPKAPEKETARTGEAPVSEDHKGSLDNELRLKLLDAHKRARQELSEFKKSFQSKKDPSESVHAVKVGFPVQAGQYEWMWVSIGGWRGGSMVGHLENTPRLRKDLQLGSVVQISEDQIFDWVIAKDAGIFQGAYTEGILSPNSLEQ